MCQNFLQFPRISEKGLQNSENNNFRFPSPSLVVSFYALTSRWRSPSGVLVLQVVGCSRVTLKISSSFLCIVIWRENWRDQVSFFHESVDLDWSSSVELLLKGNFVVVVMRHHEEVIRSWLGLTEGKWTTLRFSLCRAANGNNGNLSFLVQCRNYFLESENCSSFPRKLIPSLWFAWIPLLKFLGLIDGWFFLGNISFVKKFRENFLFVVSKENRCCPLFCFGLR